MQKVPSRRPDSARLRLSSAATEPSVSTEPARSAFSSKSNTAFAIVHPNTALPPILATGRVGALHRSRITRTIAIMHATRLSNTCSNPTVRRGSPFGARGRDLRSAEWQGQRDLATTWSSAARIPASSFRPAPERVERVTAVGGRGGVSRFEAAQSAHRCWRRPSAGRAAAAGRLGSGRAGEAAGLCRRRPWASPGPIEAGPSSMTSTRKSSKQTSP